MNTSKTEQQYVNVTDNEHAAVVLYAIGARDVSDFLDLLPDTNTVVLNLLYAMLTNPTDDENMKINRPLASIVKRVLDRRSEHR